MPSEKAPTRPEADRYHHPSVDVAVPDVADTVPTLVELFNGFFGIKLSAKSAVVRAVGNAAVPEVALLA